MEKRKIALKNAIVLYEDRLIEHGAVEIDDGFISFVGKANKYTPTKDVNEIDFPESYFIVPGFIDLHIHGVFGADVMDGTQKALKTIATALPREGTTSFLATTMTSGKTQIDRALKNISAFRELKRTEGAELLGVHLEGPFLSKAKAGAQPKNDIIKPNIELLKHWQQLAQGSIRLVTLAPEEEGGLELVRFLQDSGIVASIGHSNATYDEAAKAIANGITHCTHLFNGMTGLHHREPGTVGAALLHDRVRCELIVDGVHIRPEVVNLVFRTKGKNGIVLVTDSIRGKCLNAGIFELAGQSVTVDGKKAVLHDGTLAGSILRMIDAVKLMIDFTRCHLTEAIQMATETPAKQIGIFHRKGSIAVGKDADIVVLNEQLDVVMTICRGHITFQKMGNE